jgi:hypothetical protein
MTKSLPSNPSLKHLRLEAKNILKAHKAADVSCCGILRNLNQFKDKPDKEILKAEVGLQEVQFALAMEYGFDSWTEMKRHLQGSAKARMLHITWWKPFADQLRAAGVGDTGIWRDPVNEGPAPAGLTYADWWYTRRKFWFESGVVPREPVKPDGLSEMDKTLARYVDFDEVVLWSDSCLFDQCMLMRNLDWFAKRDLGNTRLSVVCGDECPIPAIEESSDRITEFLLGREEVSAAQFEQASAAWAAYRSPDPAAVEAFIASGGSALPYLADALTRHLQRFPSSRNGLCRYEQESLAAIKDGPVTLSLVQKRVMAMEERPFGDSEFVDGIRRMALCDKPLLSATGPDGESINMPGDVWTLSLTPLGEMVMAGEQDFIKLNGIDRWVGGVHLAGTDAQWRWDETEERLVKTGPGRPARIASAPDVGTKDIIQEFRAKGPGHGTHP